MNGERPRDKNFNDEDTREGLQITVFRVWALGTRHVLSRLSECH